VTDVKCEPNEQAQTERVTGIVDGQIVAIADAPLLTSATTPWSGFLLEEIRADLAPSDVTWGFHRTHACLVTRGSMKFKVKIGGRHEPFTVREGDVAVFPSGFGESHFVYEGAKFQVLVVQVAPERVRISNRPLPHIALKPQIGISDANIARMLSNMKDEIAAGGPSGALYGQSLSLALSAYLEDRFALCPRQSKVSGQFSVSEVQLLRDHVRANLGGDLSLSELANLFGISSSTFLRMFVRTFGVSPHQFVLGQRMDRAIALLMSGKAIAEVAHAIGFAPNYFSTAFQKAFGISPIEFRSEHKSRIHYATLTSRSGQFDE
jgi:AraC family transcriptional regulator